MTVTFLMNGVSASSFPFQDISLRASAAAPRTLYDTSEPVAINPEGEPVPEVLDALSVFYVRVWLTSFSGSPTAFPVYMAVVPPTRHPSTDITTPDWGIAEWFTDPEIAATGLDPTVVYAARILIGPGQAVNPGANDDTNPQWQVWLRILGNPESPLILPASGLLDPIG